MDDFNDRPASIKPQDPMHYQKGFNTIKNVLTGLDRLGGEFDKRLLSEQMRRAAIPVGMGQQEYDPGPGQGDVYGELPVCPVEPYVRPGRSALTEVLPPKNGGFGDDVSRETTSNVRNVWGADEEEVGTPRGYRPYLKSGGFAVKQSLMENRNGSEVTRYTVVSPIGSEMGRYRHRQVAELVAAAMNETNGSIDDPRVLFVDRLCEDEDRTIRQVNEAKRSGDARAEEAARRKLAEIRSKLGIR